MKKLIHRSHALIKQKLLARRPHVRCARCGQTLPFGNRERPRCYVSPQPTPCAGR